MPAITEGGAYTGESGKTYLAVGPLGQANVWTAVQNDEHGNIVVLKAPSTDDTGTSWPQFQHEMIMHELFKDCSYIRRQVDRVAPSENSPPLIVLEIFETTLWQARTKRPFSKDEVRSVARSILHGLQEVHDKGMVYVDIKMQNIMINGFDTSKDGDGSRLEAKLGDLGIVMEPMRGATTQPIVYRAPEVFFKGELTPAADIWAFGLVVSHLLEAKQRFANTGLYDDLHVGKGSLFEREQAMRSAIANDYDIDGEEYYKDCALPVRNPSHDPGQHWDQLRKRGLSEEEVSFLQWVMKVDPRERPSAKVILQSKWLGGEGVVPGTSNGTSSNGFPPASSAITQDPSKTSTGTAAPQSTALPETQIAAMKDWIDQDSSKATNSNGSETADSGKEPSSSAAGSNGAADGAQRPPAVGARTQDRLAAVMSGKGTPKEPGAESPRPALVESRSSGGGTYLSYR
ncbi:hypothetical protein B0A50_08507 [Salinomyces thailandicus]|uniref:Protein kinase domain-containing protein n=1 Tax=Salinomyces thailandicus TaxID=706561 RepID=A0A4U0TJ40_9PEZI|nr:hypothetical protein B0A50_08507 [Salinomyces thailandica]